jgi:sugar-specific transcriptional regulator TrmB
MLHKITGAKASMDILLEPKDDAIQVLVRLGLTRNQARVYISLVQSGVSTAKTISKASDVSREDIYRLMPMLQELGLVEKIIDTPSMYAGIPMQDAFNILMKSRKEETVDLHSKTQEIIQNFSNNNVRTAPEEDMHEFILLPGERAVIKRKQMIDTAQTSVDFIVSWNRFVLSHLTYNTNIGRALKKRVEIRIIIGQPENEKSVISLTKNWREKYPWFRVHWTSSNPEARFMLVDNRIILFAKSTATSFEEIPFLWSINQSLVSVMQNYFEILWLSSHEIKYK